ncbi:MAG TPA: hypothetical protein VFZ70_01060 [Euzebyales bacterium]
MNEPLSLPLRPDRCAVLTPYSMGRGGGNRQQPPIVEVRWRFPYPPPHVSVLRLCSEHRALLAFRGQYIAERPLADVSVGMLYDAAVED